MSLQTQCPLPLGSGIETDSQRNQLDSSSLAPCRKCLEFSGNSIQQPTTEAEMEQRPNDDIDIHPDMFAFKPDSATITQLQEETANPPCIGGIGQQQQRACKHCPAKDARIMELEELVRAHTLIKSAEELMRRSTDGYQHFEFSVPSEPIRRHIVYFNGNSQYECTYRKRYIKYDNVCHLNDKRDVRREIQTNG